MLRNQGLSMLLASAFVSLAGCSSSIEDRPPTRDGHEHAGMVHVVGEQKDECVVCDLYEHRRDSVVLIRTESGLGTGVVIDDQGSIVTNAHVVGEAEWVTVETAQGTSVRGRVERRGEAGLDLALVRTASADVKWQALEISRGSAPVVGSAVFVIGHPAGLGWTITQGIVSGTRKEGEIERTPLLQITAAVSPGNSGGPLLDARGRWIGTVVSKLVGPGLENLSFVIPAERVRGFIEGPAGARP